MSGGRGDSVGRPRPPDVPGGRTREKRPVVALDARKLARPNVGIAQYVYEVARRLPELAPEMDFRLLTDGPISPGRSPAGCSVVILGNAVRGGRLNKLRSPFWMHSVVPRYLRSSGADLFHGTNFLVPFFGPGRFVSTVHDLAFKRAAETWTFWYRNYMASSLSLSLRRTRAVIVVSKSAGDDLVGLTGVRPESVTVAHHGVGREFHPVTEERELRRVREKLRLPGRFVVHVGTVERRKNLDGLVRSMIPLLRDDTSDGLVLAGGDGYDHENIRRQAAESGFSHRMLFPGHVEQCDLAALYSMATAAAFPSWYEGFGLPVLEAMACGTPVVTSNVSSLPEVAGDAALLVAPDDIAGLTDALRRVLTNDRLRESLRRRGLARAKTFTWEASAARHVEVYRRVLGDAI